MKGNVMRIVDIIQNKRDGFELSTEEIKFLLNEYMQEKVPEYQIASFLMATYFQGMTDRELVDFTMAMRNSGDIIEFPKVDKFLVDKHSTGGVGDKVTVVLAPILASLGMATAKLSGKGLGHTGGTIDKFESIEGFNFSNTKEELSEIAMKTGIGLMGSSDKIVPLDKKIYALRDVTATVPSIPLIASSIMSKKLAIQNDVIVLDVKVGDGAFMKTIDIARELAKRMVAIGKGTNRQVKVVLSNMDEPLGHNIGNALEIIEGIEALKGNISADLKEVVYTIVSLALKAKGDIKELSEGKQIIDDIIKTGKPLDFFANFIKESGGNPEIINDYNLLPTAKNCLEVRSVSSGIVTKIKTEEIGKAAMVIGAGRETKESIIDHAVGIRILKKVGDKVEKDEVIAKIYYNDESKVNASKEMILESYVIGNEKLEVITPILDIIE
nr:thymidine phosphorylase [Streptobacillus moniliformis]